MGSLEAPACGGKLVLRDGLPEKGRKTPFATDSEPQRGSPRGSNPTVRKPLLLEYVERQQNDGQDSLAASPPFLRRMHEQVLIRQVKAIVQDLGRG